MSARFWVKNPGPVGSPSDMELGWGNNTVHTVLLPQPNPGWARIGVLRPEIFPTFGSRSVLIRFQEKERTDHE